MDKDIKYWNKLAVKAREDKEAFTELYQHFFPRVYKYLLAKTADTEAADEIISNTFMKVYEHLKVYNPDIAAFSTWIYQIAQNEMKMYWRGKKRHGEHEEEWDEEFNPAGPEEEEPERKVIEAERQSRIRAALERLPERERKIVEMTYWLNYPPRKIAEVMELTPNHVSVLLKRAKENLRKYLS